MEFILDVIADFFLDLTGKWVRENDKPKAQKWLDMIIAVVLLVSLVAYLAWKGVTAYRQGNVPMLIAVIVGVAVFVILMIFIAVRRIIRNKKKKEEME